MVKNLSFLIVLLLVFNLWGLPEVSGGNKPELHYSVFWDFYSANDMGARVWAMGGAGVANVNDLTAMVINPAALNFEDRFQFYFEVLSKSKNRWMELLGGSDFYLKSPTALPTFVGFGYKAADPLYVGLGYSSPKYYKLDYGEMFITNPESPIPVGTFHQRDVFQNKQVVWPVNLELIRGLFFAGNLNYNWISLHLRGYGRSTGESDVGFLNFKLGTLVKINQVLDLHEASKISLGVVYTPQKSFKTETEWRKPGDSTKVVKFSETVLPMEVEMGFTVCDLPFPLNFAGDVKYSRNSKIEELVDRWDIHLGAEWEKNSNLVFQFGYFSRFDYRRGPDEGWLDEVGEFDQHFLTAGVRISLCDYLLQFSIRDSHLLSSGLIETTQISVGAGVGF